MAEMDLNKEYVELRKEFGNLKAEVASKRSLDDIAKYLLYFWLSLSAVLALFGWKQISDIDQTISSAVTEQFPKESQQYLEYEKLIADTQRLHADFVALTADYKERVEDLKIANVIAGDFDLEGQVVTIVRESNVAPLLIDPQWRTKAITVLTKLKSSLAERSIPADFVFNAAQVCRQLNQFQLAEDLTTAAYAKDPNPPIRAMKLASEAANASPERREAALRELMNMVGTLDRECSPQIVLAEAWNASENVRSYQPMLDAIEKRIATAEPGDVPSYVHVIKAQVLLRRSKPGDVGRAREALSAGRAAFLAEAPLSQWNDEFARDYARLDDLVSKDRKAALEAASAADPRGQSGELSSVGLIDQPTSD